MDTLASMEKITAPKQGSGTRGTRRACDRGACWNAGPGDGDSCDHCPVSHPEERRDTPKHTRPEPPRQAPHGGEATHTHGKL